MKILFHLKKWYLMSRYYVKYRFNKWKTIHGIHLPVYFRYGYSVLRFIDNGSYESEEYGIIKKKLTSEDRVLELGTGIGFISSYCAQKVGNERVYTFEANALMKPVILETFKKNNVSPHFQIAYLGDSADRFYVQNNFLASSKRIETSRKISVNTLNLNRVISKIKPTYLVMDIEGNEYEVISKIDFCSICKIQFELHPQFLTADQVNELLGRLEINGFTRDLQVSTEKNIFFERKLDRSQ